MSFEISVTFPGRVIDSNGTVNGRSVSWKVDRQPGQAEPSCGPSPRRHPDRPPRRPPPRDDGGFPWLLVGGGVLLLLLLAAVGVLLVRRRRAATPRSARSDPAGPDRRPGAPAPIRGPAGLTRRSRPRPAPDTANASPAGTDLTSRTHPRTTRRGIAVNDLFTWAALGTVAGASAATLLTTNVIGGLLGPSGDKLRKWIAIAIALLLSYVTAAFADDAGGEKWVIAFFNAPGHLLPALGVNQFPPGNRQATQARRPKSPGS